MDNVSKWEKWRDSGLHICSVIECVMEFKLIENNELGFHYRKYHNTGIKKPIGGGSGRDFSKSFDRTIKYVMTFD